MELLWIIIGTVALIIVFRVYGAIMDINRNVARMTALMDQHLNPPPPIAIVRPAADKSALGCPHCQAVLVIAQLAKGSNLCPQCGGKFILE